MGGLEPVVSTDPPLPTRRRLGASTGRSRVSPPSHALARTAVPSVVTLPARSRGGRRTAAPPRLCPAPAELRPDTPEQHFVLRSTLPEEAREHPSGRTRPLARCSAGSGRSVPDPEEVLLGEAWRCGWCGRSFLRDPIRTHKPPVQTADACSTKTKDKDKRQKTKDKRQKTKDKRQG